MPHGLQKHVVFAALQQNANALIPKVGVGFMI